MHIMRWDVCYEIFDYELKPLHFKLPFSHVFRGLHYEFDFLKKYIYVSKASNITDIWLKEIYLKSCFILLLLYYLFYFSCEIANMP